MRDHITVSNNICNYLNISVEIHKDIIERIACESNNVQQQKIKIKTDNAAILITVINRDANFFQGNEFRGPKYCIKEMIIQMISL